jgi:hypothetical protein
MLWTLQGVVHALVIPHADLILFATSKATAISVGVLLSIYWLKEPLAPKYDFPAFALVVAGSIGLLCEANKEPTYYTFDELILMMKTKQACIYYASIVSCIFLTLLCYFWLFKSL